MPSRCSRYLEWMLAGHRESAGGGDSTLSSRGSAANAVTVPVRMNFR